MRAPAFVAATLLALAGCVTLAPLVPTDPGQQVTGAPLDAEAEAGGVRLRVRLDEWRGWPEDLEDQLTPVEVALQNDSGRPLRIEPARFALVLPTGFSVTALEPADVRRALQGRYGPRAGVAFYTGWYGVYPWPGYAFPWRRHPYPYSWWDPWGGYVAVPVHPAPPPTATVPPPSPEGTLAAGGRMSLLLFFDLPANGLGSVTFEARLAAEDGTPVATARVPFARAAPAR